jgi:hypothetical protein
MKTFTHQSRQPRQGDESGMALLTTIMVMLLMSGLMVGFFAAVVADQRANGIDRDQTQAYAAAHAGLEKLTSDLATKFETDFNPTAAEINALATHPPVIPGFSYIAPGGGVGSGYAITFTTDAKGNPAPLSTAGTTITTGAYQGFTGIVTQYTVTSTARSTGNAEVRLRRVLETVAVPVFQFGVFGDTDLSFFAGPDFDFGGRIQTNGNLYLAEGDGNTLTLEDKTTAALDVIRTQLSNGFLTSTQYTGTVNVAKAPAVYRALARNEGSVVGGPGTAVNELPTMNPGWTSLSIGTYKSYIRNGKTGGKILNLPLVSAGAKPIDLIRRPVVGEDISNPLVYTQRFYTMASIRILLSDTAAAITSLPGVTATAPVPLDGTALPAQYPVADATHPPMALADGPLGTAMAVNVAAGVASGATAIPATGIVANFAPPSYTLTIAGAGPYTCTGRDATHFYGCTNPLPAEAATNKAVVCSGVGCIGSTFTTQKITASGTSPDDGTAKGRISVVSTASFATTPLVPLLWANVAGGQSYILTCLSADNADQGSPYTTAHAISELSQCSGVGANLPNNTPLASDSLAQANQPLLNGFIKIELQNAAGVWTDVTTEILKLGIAAPNQWPIGVGALCADPSPNAVLRFERLRDSADGNCYYSGAGADSTDPTNYWPNALYDAREGNLRDANPANPETMSLAGAMYYVSLDVGNLKKYLAGAVAPYIGLNGPNAQNNNGFIVYFSDRRNNSCPNGTPAPCVAGGGESGEFGFEDVINPADVNGAPNGVLDTGEDVNGNLVLDTYGQNAVNLPNNPLLPLTNAAKVYNSTVGGAAVFAGHLMLNRPIFFRRALKLVNAAINGGVNSLPAPGLTVATENPLYIQGDYNAVPGVAIVGSVAGHVATSILADAVTFLSSSWVDVQSFYNPDQPGSRPGATTAYRVAIAAGKNLSFPQPTAWTAAQDYGTDGGVHNFLRYLEGWGGNNLYYRGSIVNLFNSRQAVGIYKCCNTVYGPPTRVYNFDSDFLLPSLLPPGTPMFRDVDTLTFRQLLRPNQ